MQMKHEEIAEFLRKGAKEDVRQSGDLNNRDFFPAAVLMAVPSAEEQDATGNRYRDDIEDDRPEARREGGPMKAVSLAPPDAIIPWLE
ncbi:uncharacterized protein BDV17DRAFT_294883 [Aspergillus undulatus]|uniref:uncharacterized protein n=1 Tax=Aspergillus undulatus TaxID=1810928 RepID=UPI003CCE4C57